LAGSVTDGGVLAILKPGLKLAPAPREVVGGFQAEGRLGGRREIRHPGHRERTFHGRKWLIINERNFDKINAMDRQCPWLPFILAGVKWKQISKAGGIRPEAGGPKKRRSARCAPLADAEGSGRRRSAGPTEGGRKAESGKRMGQNTNLKTREETIEHMNKIRTLSPTHFVRAADVDLNQIRLTCSGLRQITV
jgi:hypothetical protein